MSIKRRMWITAPVLASLLCPTLLAQTAEPNTQQNKMAVCNQQAADKKGDERKAFMSECLKNKPAPETQQEKMKRCNQDAAGKTGDERKAFMSQCLKKTGT